MRFTSRKQFIDFINIMLQFGFVLVDTNPTELYDNMSKTFTGKNVISNCIVTITKQNDFIIISFVTKTYYELLEIELMKI